MGNNVKTDSDCTISKSQIDCTQRCNRNKTNKKNQEEEKRQEKIKNQKTAKRLSVNDKQVNRFIEYFKQAKTDKILQITKKEQMRA